MRTASRIPLISILEVRDPHKIKFGLMADLHYPRDKEEDSTVTGHADTKLQEFADFTDEQDDLVFTIDLGDLIDTVSGEGQAEGIQHMQSCAAIIRDNNNRLLHVLGNHEMDTNNKEDFINNTLMKEWWYSFDAGNFHFVVLDANYTSDDDDAYYSTTNHDWEQAWINPSQRDWLENDLENTDKPTVVIVHQRLDEGGHTHHPIKNRVAVRTILENSGKVLCALTGHSHRSIHSFINGIHYFCFVGARSYWNAYSIIELTDEKISVTGYGNEETYEIRFKKDITNWYGNFNDPPAPD